MKKPTESDLTTRTDPAASRPCDALIRTGMRMGQHCRARATLYDASRQLNVCAKHRTERAIPGSGTSWYDVGVVRGDGFDAALSTDICESGRHAQTIAAKAVKNGVALCLLCSFDAELDELRGSRAADDAGAAA